MLEIEKLYKSKRSVYLNYLTKRNIDLFVAEEIVNDVFVQLNSYYSEEHKVSPNTIGYIILKSRMRDYWRKNEYKNKALAVEISDATPFIRPVENSIISNIDLSIIKKTINKYLKTLDKEESMIVKLYLKGYKLEEISRLTKVGMNNVKSKLYRNLKVLRTLMEKR